MRYPIHSYRVGKHQPGFYLQACVHACACLVDFPQVSTSHPRSAVRGSGHPAVTDAVGLQKSVQYGFQCRGGARFPAASELSQAYWGNPAGCSTRIQELAQRKKKWGMKMSHWLVANFKLERCVLAWSCFSRLICKEPPSPKALLLFDVVSESLSKVRCTL